MIEDFKCKETKNIWEGKKSRKFPSKIQNRALCKLRLLDASARLEDLRMPPSNHLEALKGKRKGRHSIRINRQWRICFKWKQNGSFEVEIVDYH